MRAFFASTFFALVLLSLVAWRIQPAPPGEDYNEVWREVAKRARPGDWSAFINGQTASRILAKQMDLIRNDQKPVREAMRGAARLVNEEIAKTLEMDPSLRGKYYHLTGRERPWCKPPSYRSQGDARMPSARRRNSRSPPRQPPLLLTRVPAISLRAELLSSVPP